MESQAQLLQQHRSQTPEAFKTSIIPNGRGAWAPACVSTEQHLHGTTTTEEAQVAEGLPEETNGIGNSNQKRQRQNHAHHCQLFTRAQFPGGRFPAKFGFQPIKLKL